MIKKLPIGLRAAALILLIGGCSSGTAATPVASSSPAATATTAPPATSAPSATPSASAPVTTGKTMAVAEVNASGMGGAFNPPLLQVQVGDAVEWTNSSGNIHNVTFADSTMHSPIMFRGDKWSQVFTKPGTYKYTCTFHPGMEGTIVVA